MIFFQKAEKKKISGKTVLTKKYEIQGYCRIDRDELGGSLNDLVLHVARQYVERNTFQFVMDNTYPTVESRQSIIKWTSDNDSFLLPEKKW